MQECGTPNAKLGEYLEAAPPPQPPPPGLKIFTLLLVGCPTFTIYQLPSRPRPRGSWYIFAYSSSP